MMNYIETKPHWDLSPFINFFWELKGMESDYHWERVFPDGCLGILINLGKNCLTDNGSRSLKFGKTYVVGAMTSFKDTLIDRHSHLVGACLRPATLSNFYNYTPENILHNDTIEFDVPDGLNADKIINDPIEYLNRYFTERNSKRTNILNSVINDIDASNGQLRINEISRRNHMNIRQLERNFKKHVGMSPKEYSNIVRFRNALAIIKGTTQNRSLSDISFECGYFDHSHLSHEIKRITGKYPSQL